MKTINEITDKISELPLGDPEIDHSILDKLLVETLSLVEERFIEEEAYDDLHLLVSLIVQKSQEIEGLFWYA